MKIDPISCSLNGDSIIITPLYLEDSDYVICEIYDKKLKQFYDGRLFLNTDITINNQIYKLRTLLEL